MPVPPRTSHVSLCGSAKLERVTCFAVTFLAVLLIGTSAQAAQIDIPGPPGSGAFGNSVAVLPNGNFVVTDPNGPTSNIGAVYLYGPSGALISSFTGSAADDHVGIGGIHVLPSGNFVVLSPQWHDYAGAVTWVNGTTGLSGIVSVTNSLIGPAPGDQVGGFGIVVLSNGNYVVRSPNCDNGTSDDAGAATWVNGSTGLSGAVSAGNSLVGVSTDDRIGESVVALSNGNYVVPSRNWDNGVLQDAGAATWANGSTGRSGAVSVANSLVGTALSERVGVGVVALSNGNYVVLSPFWNGSKGAATWANGISGFAGTISSANSLTGTTAEDRVGLFVTALSNGNYVVGSPTWRNATSSSAGAATWANGNTGLSGVVSAGNSLVGISTGDRVGDSIVALSNGNYVVASQNWDNNTTADVGAVTWASGSTGSSGLVNPANSLIGTTANDFVGGDGVSAGLGGVTALRNGNYVVGSPRWRNAAFGVSGAGAATWGNGDVGVSGSISSANSLVGNNVDDNVGMRITALSNGNYVVTSNNPHSGPGPNAGAVTWADGSAGFSGFVSVANSLGGSAANDAIGSSGVVALSNGNYVVGSPGWDGANMNVGAVTWANGRTGRSGVITATNSLVGTFNDGVGSAVTALGNGSYVVTSSYWHNGAIRTGAVSLGRGNGGLVGSILSTNSVIGTVAEGGPSMTFAYDATRDQLIVGQPAGNLVSLFRTDSLFASGFE